MTTGLTLGVLVLGSTVKRADERAAVAAMAAGAVLRPYLKFRERLKS